MLKFRVISLMLLVFLAGCSRRWEERVLDAGVFSVVEHWIETEYWMLDRRSGVEYTKVCNSATRSCYISGGGYRDQRRRTAWLSVSPESHHAALYTNNVNGRLLDMPNLLFFEVISGREIACVGKEFMNDVKNTGYVWKSDKFGAGTTIGSEFDTMFIAEVRNGGCKIDLLKKYSKNMEPGPYRMNSDATEIAWGVCGMECKVLVINIATRKERYYPIDRCESPPHAGYATWIDGRLSHRCSSAEERRFLEP